jgi:hypothetical protein
LLKYRESLLKMLEERKGPLKLLGERKSLLRKWKKNLKLTGRLVRGLTLFRGLRRCVDTDQSLIIPIRS